MYSNLPKFLLLGVMIFVTLFLSQHSLRGFQPTEDFRENSEDYFYLSAVAEGVPASEAPEVLLSRGSSLSGFLKVGEDSPPKLQAKAALLAGLDTGEVYYELNPSMRWPLASVTKLASVAVGMDFLDRSQEVQMTEEDFEPALNSYVLQAGGRYQVSDLLWAMLLGSSNEAANALARVHGHSNFVEAMNVKAERWGLKETHFDDPTGISISNQSNLYDLKEMVASIFEVYPDIFKMTTRSEWTIHDLNGNIFSKVFSNNDFAGRADFLGGKTGYTEESIGNLVSLFSYQDRPVMIIVLGTPDRFGETRLLYNWFRENYNVNLGA